MNDATLPPLAVVGPGGERLALTELTEATTVADLCRTLGVSRISFDDVEATPTRRLADVDALVHGARLHRPEAAPDDTAASGDPSSSWTMLVESGPDAGMPRPLPCGRRLVGRAADADVVVDDGGMEAYHLMTDDGAEGHPSMTLTMTQLAGGTPALVDGAPLVDVGELSSSCRLAVGRSTIVLRPPGVGPVVSPSQDGAEPRAALARDPRDPWRRVLRRAAPLGPPPASPPPVETPRATEAPAGPSPVGLVGSVAGVAGAFVVAAVMGSAMFVVLALVGSLVALATWTAGAVSARRARRRARRAAADDLARFRHRLDRAHAVVAARHRQDHPGVADALACAEDPTRGAWSRRGVTALRAVVGVGPVRRPPVLCAPGGGAVVRSEVERHDVEALVDAASVLRDARCPVAFEPGVPLAVTGEFDLVLAVVRSIVVQLAVWAGPADWRLLIVSSSPRRWAWADWLPHGLCDDSSTVAASELAVVEAIGRRDRDDRPLVVVTDDVATLGDAASGLRQLVDGPGVVTLVAVDRDGPAPVPSICRRVLRIGATGVARWDGDTPASDLADSIRVTGITEATATTAARRLARLVDPEAPCAVDAGLPGALDFAELYPVVGTPWPGSGPAGDLDAVIHRWRVGGVDPAPVADIGRGADGPVRLDLDRDGPHGLIAGTTGSGKSELLRAIVLALAVEVSPEHLNLILVDYKGGATFDACARLPHTVGVVTDLDDGLAERSLVGLTAELHRRERAFRSVGAVDLGDYRSRPGTEPMPRLVVVVDEFAALAREVPHFLHALVDVARRGRSLGVHLLLATQRPAGVVTDEIRANTNLRLALRVHDRADALDVVGDVVAATLPRRHPGRAVLRLGPDELVVFQSPRCTGPAGPPGPPERRRVDAVVEVLVAAAAHAGLPAARRPWTDPLPHPLTAETCAAEVGGGSTAAGVIGLVDDPVGQRRLPLSWRPVDGNLALVGSTGSGITSTLVALAASLCVRRSPADVHLYVLDARGEVALAALRELAHVGGVIGVGEVERVRRLLERLVAEIAGRRLTGWSPASGSPRIVLLVDGWAPLRSTLAAAEYADALESLGRVVADGPAVGVNAVLGDDGAAAHALPTSVAHRWVFALDDPALARSAGLGGRSVGSGRPGRCLIASSGLEAQVVLGAPGLAELATRDVDHRGPARVAVVPRDVVAEPTSAWCARLLPGGREIAVGVGAGDGAARLTVDDGRAVVVIGAARSGVSTALDRLIAGWWAPGESRLPVVRLDGGRVGAAGDLLPQGRCLVVVDDASRSPDADGALRRIAARETDRVDLVVGVHGDELRSAFGHWVRDALRARCGLVMADGSEVAAELFGIALPRRPVVATRPGLAWLVDGGEPRQVQIARESTEGSPGRVDARLA